MRIDHSGETAVVTGAARGIGKEIASMLAEGGADIALFDILETVEETAAALEKEHDISAVGQIVDVGEFETVQENIKSVADDLGNPSILVNNAAITTNVAPILDMSPEDWEREVQVNLTGAFNCTKAALPYMTKGKFGRVVNISSGAGQLGGYGQSSYSSSKSGILGLTKTTALEHARDGVTANAIVPGLIKSSASEAIRDDMLERLIKTIPVRERGEPNDIAAAVSFLASKQANYINGAELNIDAGQRLFVF